MYGMCVDKGIPEFWLTAMKHTDIFDDYIMVSVKYYHFNYMIYRNTMKLF